MGQIVTSIRLMDNVTQVLANINRSIDATVSAFEKMDGSTGASFAEARAGIVRTQSQLGALTKNLKQNNEPLKKQTDLWTGMKSKIGAAAGAYAGFQSMKSLIGLSDSITQTMARLDLMNDGLQSTGELSDKIYASADRARGGYLATADAVSKLGTMAGDAFSSSDEIIAFTEQLNKQFTIAGTSIEGQQAAMLQLTQAMGSGALRGEELNSVLEQAPNIVQTIADYMDKPKGAIKDLAAEGKITSDIVKDAMLSAAEETDKKFNSMPKTFGQTWMEIKNAATKSFEEISVQLSDALNGAQVQQMVQSIISALPGIIEAISEVLSYAMKAGSFIADNWSVIGPVIAGVASAFMAFKTVTTVSDTIKKVTDGMEKLKDTAGAVSGLKGIFSIFKVNPVFLAIAAIAGIITAIVLLWKKCEGFRNAVTGIWNGIKDGFVTVWTAVTDFFTVTVPGAFHAVLGFFQSIPAFFQNIWNNVKSGFMAAWNAILANPVIKQIVTTIRTVWGTLKTALSGIWNGIKMAATGAWNLIKNVILGPVLLLIDLVTGNFAKLKTDAAMIWNNIKTAAFTIWSGIKTAVLSAVRGLANTGKALLKGFWNTIKSIFTTIKQFISGVWSAIRNKIVGTVIAMKEKAVGGFRNMISGIKTQVSKIRETVVQGFEKAIKYITELPEKAIKWGADFIDGMVEGIKSKVKGLFGWVEDIGSTIREFLHFSRPDKGPLRDYESWMPDFMQGLAKGIRLNAPEVIGNIRGLAEDFRVLLNGEVSDFTISSAQANEVRTAAAMTAYTSSSHTANNIKNHFEITVRNEADENRLIEKFKRVLEEELYSGAKGVHV